MDILEKIKFKLEQAFPGAIVEVSSRASQHIGHNPGGIHVGVTVTSSEFKGQSTVEQHQMIYKVLAPEMKKEIHSLQIKTKIE